MTDNEVYRRAMIMLTFDKLDFQPTWEDYLMVALILADKEHVDRVVLMSRFSSLKTLLLLKDLGYG